MWDFKWEQWMVPELHILLLVRGRQLALCTVKWLLTAPETRANPSRCMGLVYVLHWWGLETTVLGHFYATVMQILESLPSTFQPWPLEGKVFFFFSFFLLNALHLVAAWYHTDRRQKDHLRANEFTKVSANLCKPLVSSAADLNWISSF